MSGLKRNQIYVRPKVRHLREKEQTGKVYTLCGRREPNLRTMTKKSQIGQETVTCTHCALAAIETFNDLANAYNHLLETSSVGFFGTFNYGNGNWNK